MNTSEKPGRRSPIHHRPQPLYAAEQEQALRTLCLCDLSTLPKLGVKGAGAEAWLRDQGVDMPATTYETRRLADGGLIARLGTADFFLEGGPGDVLSLLDTALAATLPRVYRVERHDATFVLGEAHATDVLAQLCSFDFRSAPVGRLVLTRAAGVICAILPRVSGGVPRLRLWVDPTYASFLWETLIHISAEFGGRVVSELPSED